MKPRLLYVASRWPYPVRSGRARMIAQTLEMAASTHEVHLAAFASEEDMAVAPPEHVASSTRLSRPSALSALANAAKGPMQPLQSHLFNSGAAVRSLRALAGSLRPDVAMFDMIRLASYAEAVRSERPGTRCVLDMDDLLSARYAQMDGANDILGAFSRGMPAPVRAVAGTLPRALLGIESRLVARAESRAARDMDAVVLVSGREAGLLRGRSGVRDRAKIHDVPPSVPPTASVGRDFSGGVRVVFFGDETYAPNAEALRAFDGIAGSFRPLGTRRVTFEAAGRTDPRIVTPNVRRLGFVDDLDAFLGADAILVAPLRTGTGIKTKLLDAFARGVPVVTTPKGVEGLDLDAGTDVVVEPNAAAISAILPALLAGGSDAYLDAIGASGSDRIRVAHEPARVARNLLKALGPEAAHA